MVTGWPFGTLRNVCRKVIAIQYIIYITLLLISMFEYIIKTIIFQVLFLEIWTTSLVWVCSWTRIPMRRNTWRYAGAVTAQIQPVFGKKSSFKKNHRRVLLQICVSWLSLCSFVQPFGVRRRRKDILLALR